MSQPSDPTAPRTPTDTDGQRRQLTQATEILRQYVVGPEVDDPQAALRRDLDLLRQLTDVLMPAATLRAGERDGLGYLIGDRRDDLVQWLKEVGVTESWSLAQSLETGDPPAADIATRLAIIDTARQAGFQSVAESLHRYTYLRAAAEQAGGLPSGGPSSIGQRLAEAHEAFGIQLNRAGLSSTERRHTNELLGEYQHHDLTELSDADLIDIFDADASLPGPGPGAGRALAERVNELAVWRRLIAGESETPYFASLIDSGGNNRISYHPSESVARQWLLDQSWTLNPDAIVGSAIYRPDPVTGAQRLCWQTHAMTVAEHVAQLERIATLSPRVRRSSDDYLNTKRIDSLRTDYLVASQQLNDPGAADPAFETALHRDNLRTQLLDFAQSTGRLEQATRSVKEIDQWSRPVRLTDLDRTYTPYLDEAIGRAEQHLAELKFQGVWTSISDGTGTGLDPRIGWTSDDYSPYQWIYQSIDTNSIPLYTDKKYATLTDLLANHPEHSPAAADILREFDSDLKQAQTNATVAQAYRDSVRTSSPMPTGLIPDGVRVERRDSDGKLVSEMTVGSGCDRARTTMASTPKLTPTPRFLPAKPVHRRTTFPGTSAAGPRRRPQL
ncbi:hypothetical protein [Nocardia sp. NPDC003963]